MVIVAVAGDNAIGTVEDCAAHGVKVAVVMASGFGEVDAVEGKAKERRMVEAAHKVCPYSNATRGNIDVALTANGQEVDPVTPAE